MGRVEEQIAEYLRQGESIREAFDVGPVRVVLTSHRVFVSDPDDEGIQQAELPGVTGIERTTRGSRSGLIWGVALAVIGVAFLAVGVSTRLGGAFTAPEFRGNAAEQAGAGGLTDLVDLLIWLVENIDIRLGGEQSDIHLPLEYVSVEDELRLEKALVPEQVSDDLAVEGNGDTAPDDAGEPSADSTRGDDSEHSFGWVGDDNPDEQVDTSGDG